MLRWIDFEGCAKVGAGGQQRQQQRQQHESQLAEYSRVKSPRAQAARSDINPARLPGRATHLPAAAPAHRHRRRGSASGTRQPRLFSLASRCLAIARKPIEVRTVEAGESPRAGRALPPTKRLGVEFQRRMRRVATRATAGRLLGRGAHAAPNRYRGRISAARACRAHQRQTMRFAFEDRAGSSNAGGGHPRNMALRL
jgi:hypothetical protein